MSVIVIVIVTTGRSVTLRFGIMLIVDMNLTNPTGKVDNSPLRATVAWPE